MQLIQADLKAVGINTTFASADFPTYLKQLDAGKFQIARLGWVADYPIMDNFLYPLFDSKSTDNKSFYVNPAVDSGITEARAVTDSRRSHREVPGREHDRAGRQPGRADHVLPSPPRRLRAGQ